MGKKDQMSVLFWNNDLPQQLRSQFYTPPTPPFAPVPDSLRNDLRAQVNITSLVKR